MERRTGLSKSRITTFEQCPKRLWLSVYKPEAGHHDAATEARFAVGHEVGAIACGLLPDGYMIEATSGLAHAVEQTASLIRSGRKKPLFEATFAFEDVLVRVDLLVPAAAGWHVAEVKSSTSVKDYHLGDLATQLWVMRSCEVPVASASIRHLDRDFVLQREGDYSGLFADAVLADELEPLIAGRPALVAGARAALQGAEPTREIGDHCDTPFECEFKAYCSRDQPPGPEWPLSILPDTKGKQVARQWAEQGINDLMLVPAGSMPTAKLANIHNATLTGEPWHDHHVIAEAAAGWAWPHTFLDFETIQFAVPRWIGTRPWQQVPFQFSAHIEDIDGALGHYEFLSIDGDDPRRACAEALARLPTGSGNIIAWNMSFERRCLLELASACPDLAPVLEDMASRLVDLWPVVRSAYYHRDMRGSWSIKAVLPTVAADLGYDTLADVQSGTDAQAGYLEAIHPETTAERRTVIRQALLDYCRRDTEGIIAVLKRLSQPMGKGARTLASAV